MRTSFMHPTTSRIILGPGCALVGFLLGCQQPERGHSTARPATVHPSRQASTQPSPAASQASSGGGNQAPDPQDGAQEASSRRPSDAPPPDTSEQDAGARVDAQMEHENAPPDESLTRSEQGEGFDAGPPSKPARSTETAAAPVAPEAPDARDGEPPRSAASMESDRPVELAAPPKSEPPANPNLYTLKNNPTTQAGRGEPSLLDPKRPCVWISLDEKDVRMGKDRMQCELDEPVGSTPTFMIRSIPQVLGDVVKVRLALLRLEPGENARFMNVDDEFQFVIEAKRDRALEAGVAYPLCTSAELLTYSNVMSTHGAAGPSDAPARTGLEPLPPGTYELLAEIVGSRSREKTLAITRFEVKGGA